jgi:tRNA nucleotidyltransferase/poly(A) polymerase
MTSPHVGLALAVLQKIGFFVDLIPEIQAGLDLKSSKSFKEIWPHTIVVVSKTPPILSIRWAALFHDLGKAQAFKICGNKVTFHNHELISAGIFDRFSRRTDIFQTPQKRYIRFLIANLGYIESYDSKWSDGGVRRFDKEIGFHLDNLFILSEADICTANQQKRNSILRKMQEFKDRIIEIREKDSKLRPLPKGLGNVIAEKLNIPLGPKIGEVMRSLEEKIESGSLNGHEGIDYYIEHLKVGT